MVKITYNKIIKKGGEGGEEVEKGLHRKLISFIFI